MKFEFDINGCSVEIFASAKTGFLGTSVYNNINLCSDNGYNGDNAYVEIEDLQLFEKFVKFCKEVVKEWELKDTYTRIS